MPVLLDYDRKRKYKIMSRQCCERYCQQNHSQSSIIISIRSSWDKIKPSLPVNTKNNVKHILSLTFDDFEHEQMPEHCMTYDDGKKIADFVNEYYDKVDLIIQMNRVGYESNSDYESVEYDEID